MEPAPQQCADLRGIPLALARPTQPSSEKTRALVAELCTRGWAASGQMMAALHASAMGSTPDNPVAVVSAVVVRGDRKEEILLGVRRETPLARRHPGVLSVPTVGVPMRLFDLLTEPYSRLRGRPGAHA